MISKIIPTTTSINTHKSYWLRRDKKRTLCKLKFPTYKKINSLIRWVFLNRKISIIFDYNALLSILYLIFWCFYNYFWCFGLSLSVFHDFLGQNLILLCLPTSYQKWTYNHMWLYENIQNIWFADLVLTAYLIQIQKVNIIQNNSWKIEISIFCKIFKKKWKIHDYDTTSLSHIIMNSRAIWVLVPSKFQIFSKVFEFLKFYKILSFLVKICLYGWKQIFRWSW